MLEGKGSGLRIINYYYYYYFIFIVSLPSFRGREKRGGREGGGGCNIQDWCECRYQIPEKGHDCFLRKEEKERKKRVPM